jgi:hypothetical protein
MDQPRKATVMAGSDGAKCLTLDREAFDMFADQNAAIFEERQEAYAEAALEEMDDLMDDGASTMSASTSQSAPADDGDSSDDESVSSDI